MKNVIVAIGIIFLCLGLIVFSFRNLSQESILDDDFVRKEDEWKISREDFNRGENLSVGFIPGYNWAWPPHQDHVEIDGIMFALVKYLFVNVTDFTTGNYTEFMLYLIIPPEPYDPGQIRLYPKIQVTHHGALTVEDYPPEIGGIVEHDGKYSVGLELFTEVTSTHVLNVLPNGSAVWEPIVPPSELRLYRITKEITYPYAFLLAVGPVTMGVGVVAVAWGIRSDKPKTKYTKTRFHDIRNRRTLLS